MAEELTPIEQKVYHYLLDFLVENTYQPSVREIGRKFRIKSTKTVSDLLQSLATKGYIERDPSRSRGVRLLGHAAPRQTIPIPFYGKIHAGEPSLLPENRARFITMDRCFVQNDSSFFLRIEGDSMTGRGINNGDYVMVNPETAPKDGDVVAARLGDQATIKTLTHQGSQVVPKPAHPDERDIAIGPNDDYAALGVVCGIFRPFFDGAAEAAAADVN